LEIEAPANAGRVVPWLYCSDIARSTGFYCDVLGFTLLGQTPAEKSAYVDSLGARIMLQEMGEGALLAGTPDYPFGRGVYLLLQAEDVDALHARLCTEAGEQGVLMKPRNRYYRVGEDMVGHREIVVKDPDGYVLRFYHTIEGLEEA
jgi:catechol 2,3-dioxygenase-like lactoylglutathione lyase family enzyme